jgi:hypothetical protein
MELNRERLAAGYAFDGRHSFIVPAGLNERSTGPQMLKNGAEPLHHHPNDSNCNRLLHDKHKCHYTYM